MLERRLSWWQSYWQAIALWWERARVACACWRRRTIGATPAESDLR